MEAEKVLNPFDSYWLEHEIFTKIKVHKQVEQPKSFMGTIQNRSQSGWSLDANQKSFSSYSRSPKLQKMPSGIKIDDSSLEIREEVIEKKKKPVHRRNRKRNCKSLSELEVEELKGFTDMGFVFSEEDEDSKLVTIVPGSNRLQTKGVGEMKNGDFISRPYLSEAWGVLDKEIVSRKLVDWKIQPFNDRTNMKNHLKVWAQTVASALRY